MDTFFSQGDKIHIPPMIFVQVVEFAEFHFQLRFLSALLRFKQVTQITYLRTTWKLSHHVAEEDFNKFWFNLKEYSADFFQWEISLDNVNFVDL